MQKLFIFLKNIWIIWFQIDASQHVTHRDVKNTPFVLKKELLMMTEPAEHIFL